MTKTTKNKDATINGSDSKKRIIMIIAGVFALIGVIIYIMSGSSSDENVESNVKTTKVEANTGSPIQSEDSDYTRQVIINNENEAEQAFKANKSHLDVQTNELEDNVDENEFLNIKTAEVEDVSTKEKEIVEKTVYVNNTIIQEVAIPDVEPYDYLKDFGLATMFSQQLVNKDFAQINVSNLEKRETLKREAEEKEIKENEIKKSVEAQKNITANTITVYKVGDLVPAVLETKVISTQQSPVRVRISSGPFRGAIVTGTFDKGPDGVILRLSTLSHDMLSESIAINAVALDFKRATTSLATSINRHIPERILMTFAGSFAKGYADALSTNNNTGEQTIIGPNGTTTTSTQVKKTVKEINKESSANAISTTADMINSAIPNEPTIRVNANTEIGLYFMSDLIIDKSKVINQ